MIDQLQQIILETSIKHIGTKVKTLGLLPKVLELTNYLPENSTITQRIWHIINKTTKYKCSCGNNLKFLGIVKGYTVGCSNNCIDTIKSKSNKIKEVKSKITLKQQKNINEKRKETLLKKYNVSHNSKIAKVVKNRKQTYFKNKKAGKHKTSIGFKDVNTREKASSMFKKKNPGYLNPYQLPSTRKARKKKGYTKEQITKSKETRFKNYYEIYIQELRKYDLELLCNVEDFKGVYFQKYTFKHSCGNIFENNTYGGDTNIPTCRKCNPINSFQSKQEKELFNFVKNLCPDAYNNDRLLIKPQELDIVIPSKKIAIEFCGLLWHSENYGNKNKNYHYNKMIKCKELGYTLITIFDDEWNNKQNIIKSVLTNMLTNVDKIGARKCKIALLDKNLAKEFTENNHLQGHTPAKVYYGAFYDNELISVMSFSKNRRITGSKKDSWEIIRFCSNRNIIGIASKFFKQFIKDFNPKSVISYCDLRWFNGSVYSYLGMNQTNIPKPSYWYTKDYKKRLHRYNFTKQRLVKDFNQSKDLTESQIMANLGYDKIWDCGQARFEINFY